MSDIEQLRNRINEITLHMTRLLKERTDIARQIGQLKKSSGLGVTDEVREGQLREEIIRLCREIGLDESLGKKFLNFLLNESVKVQSDGKQTHISIFLKAKEMERQGKKMIHLEVGEPDMFPPISAKAGLEEAFDTGRVRYGPTAGIPELRASLAEHVSKNFGRTVGPENILVTPGGRFSVFLAINTLLDPGDEMIVIEPAWPAYRECAINAGVKVRAIQTTLEGRWEPSISQIEEAVNANTKMIVLNYPNNPTGKILPPALQDQIIEIAKKNDLYVLSDEIYFLYAYGDWKSALASNYEKTVITQSFSKSHAMTGFRIGYTVAEKDTVSKMSRLQALCITNVAEPIQYAALKALNSDLSGFKRAIKSKIDTVVAEAKKINLEFEVPDGAMYVFARPKKEGFDGTSFTNRLLDSGVAVAPGEGFGNYKGFIRISVAQDEDTLREGIKILDSVLKGL